MSFTTKRTNAEGLPQGPVLQLRRSTSAPAFKPQIVRSIRMHPLLAAGVGVSVLMVLVGYALLQKPVYQAISEVQEEPASARLLGDPNSAVFDANKYETFLGEQIQLVQRQDVLTAAVNSLPKATWAEFGSTAQQAAENIQSQMKVQRVATSKQLSISLKGTDAARTADVVNAVTTAYLDAVHKANVAESDERSQLLAEERQRIESELQTARTEQTALDASIGVANPTGENGNPFDSQLSGIRGELAAARAAHDVAAAQLSSWSSAGPSRTSGLTAAADELIAADSGLGSLKASISQRKATLSGQMAGMTPTNPAYKQYQDEIADLDRTQATMTAELRDKAARLLQDKLRSELERTGDLEARLNGELAHQIATATTAAPKMQRASEVAADIQRLDIRQAAVDDALRGLRMEANGPGQVRLSLAATAPEHPEPNRQRLLLLAALPLAFLFGAGAAVLARKQDHRIYGGVDIEDVLGFPPLAILPARADVPERVFDEYVLRLAAGIESAYRTSGARTFLLTAVSLTTDIDPLATALTRTFEEIGVNVVAATAGEMLEPIEVTPVPVEGTPTPHETELATATQLWTEGFVAANMARMKTEHGLVLIESQALLNCAQTEYVARCADATILVIECGVTTRQELYQAAALLERLNVTGIGAVMEELQLRFADAGFRQAIDSLDRRQSEAVRQVRRAPAPEPRPVKMREPRVEPVAAALQPVIAPPQPVAPAPAEVAIPPEVAIMEPAAAASEPTRAFVERVPVPAKGDVVAEDSAWLEAAVAAHFELKPERAPVLVPAAAELVENIVETGVPEAVAATTIRRGFAAARTVGPVLVDKDAEIELDVPEKIAVAAGFRSATGSSREKMAPKLSERRKDPAPDGEQRMTRKSSWLGRLLGRGEPFHSIIPEDDDEDGEVETAVAQPPPPSIAEVATRNKEEYDLPLVARLDQISRSRPVAPDSQEAPSKTRLQIVPDLAPELENDAAELESSTPATALAEAAPVETSIYQAAETGRSFFTESLANEFRVVHEPELLGVVTEPPAAEPIQQPIQQPMPEPIPAAIATAAEDTAQAAPVELPALAWAAVEPAMHFAQPPAAIHAPEPLAALTQPAPAEPAPAAPMPSSPAKRGPRRPLSFQELAELALQPPVAPVAPVPAATRESVAAIEPESLEAASGDTMQVAAESVAPVDEAGEPLVVHESIPAIVHAASHAAESIAEPEPAALVEAAAAPLSVPVALSESEFGEMSSPYLKAYQPSYREPEPAALPQAAAPAPAPEFAELSSPSIKAYQPSYTSPVPTPIAAELTEHDDIRPVFEEASRHLTTGRWDPIPPLRPSQNGWRDRLSPVPPSNNGAGAAERRRWTGATEDALSGAATNRWTPETMTEIARQTDPLPEPLLSRQWGLLSRFQQQRISSSRPAADTAVSDSDPAHETAKPGSSNGNGNHQS